MHRRGRAGKMPNSIHFKFDWFGYIVTNEFKIVMTHPTSNVDFSTSEVVIQTNDLLISHHQPIDQMRTEKASPTSNEISHPCTLSQFLNCRGQSPNDALDDGFLRVP